MRLRLRLLWILLASAWRKPLRVLEESVLTTRVLLNDVDVSKMTNDRFVALMDLGRMDLAFRLGLARTMLRRRWVPVATNVVIRFRHPLRVMRQYHLRTRIVYWDEDKFYFQQRFEAGGRIDATGYVCATLLGPRGPVRPGEILAAVGQPVSRPEKPAMVERLQELDSLLHQEQHTEPQADSTWTRGRSPPREREDRNVGRRGERRGRADGRRAGATGVALIGAPPDRKNDE